MTSPLPPPLWNSRCEKIADKPGREEDLHADRSIRRQQIHRQLCHKHLLNKPDHSSWRLLVLLGDLPCPLTVPPSCRHRLPNIHSKCPTKSTWVVTTGQTRRNLTLSIRHLIHSHTQVKQDNMEIRMADIGVRLRMVLSVIRHRLLGIIPTIRRSHLDNLLLHRLALKVVDIMV